MPGETSSAVTCLDGHQMARKGQAGAALAIAALGSFFAGTRGDGLRRRRRHTAVRARAQVRPRRILLADGAGTDRRRRARARLAAQGDRDDRARPAARHRRHRRQFRRRALRLRHSGADRRHRRGRAWRWASSASPRSSPISRSTEKRELVTSKVKGLWSDEGAVQGGWPAVLRGTGLGLVPRPAPGRRRDARVLRVLRASRRRSPRTRRNSARARSRASPARSRPTTPARRRRSSRC